MALLIGDNFNYQANKPNFERDSFKTLEDMRTYPETSIDDGHISYCKETDKHYKFVSSNTVDGTTGKWREFETGAGIPEGGTTGQVLTKTEDGAEWQDPQATLPEGGTTGQVLTKTASGVEWKDVPEGENELPSGGTNGQVLTKTSSGTAWQNVPTELPSGGTEGQVLKKTSSGVEWGTDEKGFELPPGGSDGQVLKKQGQTVVWGNDNNTTYQKATQQTDGLMSKEDKEKLDNISTAYATILTQGEYDSLNPKEENKIYYIKG